MPDSQSSVFATYPSLEDKTVVISGGASGIGERLTTAFAQQGSRVIVLDIQDDAAAELLQTLAAATASVKHPAVYHRCDLTDVAGALRPVAAGILARHPAVHAVINNAAHDERMPTMAVTPAAWDHGLNVNLRHQFFLTQALMPGLVAAGSAAVINMGSISWANGATGLVPYVASKAAVVGLTRTLAREFGPQGVRVNSIMPGAIATARQKTDVLTPEYEAHVLGQQALKRLLLPDDVARLALWLVADDGAAVTSQSIVVDGGWI